MADYIKEFAKYEGITQTFKINLYFCKPYHYWEHSANNNTNVLIWQYNLNGTDFSEVIDTQIGIDYTPI